MSKYSFIDGYGNEQPMPLHLDNDEAQYQRGFTGGSYWQDASTAARAECEGLSLSHDLKCEAFKRGWEDGKRHMAMCQCVAEGEYQH